MNMPAVKQSDTTSVSLRDLDWIREKISLFGGLTDDQLTRLLPCLKLQHVSAGDLVFDQGQLPCNVYILISGCVKMTVTCDDGSERALDFVAGDCLGETAVMGIQPQVGRAEASRAVQMLVLSRSSLLELSSSEPELFGLLMMNIAREVSRRLHNVVAIPRDQTEVPISRA